MKRRAFTLAEVLTVSFLLLCVLGLVWSVMVPTFRMYAFSQSRLQVRQSAIQALYRLTTEIQNTVPEALTLVQAPTTGVPVALSLVELDQFSVSGAFSWHQGFEIFYFDKPSEKVLWRRIKPPGYDFAQAAPPNLLIADMVSIIDGTTLSNSGEKRVVAINVDKCTIQDAVPGDAFLTFPITISIDTRIEESTDPLTRKATEIFHLESQVVPRSKRW